MADFEWVKISARGLPGFHPSYNFIETLYDNEFRVRRYGIYTVDIETERPFKLVDEQTPKIQKVQSQIYNKYELILLKHEDVQIQLLEKCQDLWFTYNDGAVHKGRIVESITPEWENDTSIVKYRIIYADINEQNYGNITSPVSNFLESRSLFLYDRFPYQTQLSYLYFKSAGAIDSDWALAYTLTIKGSTYTSYTDLPCSGGALGTREYVIWTALASERVTSEPVESQDQDGDFQLIINRRVTKKVMRIRFYVGEDEMNIVMRYLRCCYDNSGEIIFVDRATGQSVTASEAPTVQAALVTAGIDLYQLDIDLPYSVIDYKPYA